MPHLSSRTSPPKAIMCWSGGKDSAMALWQVRQENQFEISGLLTTVSLPYNRISMHGVRRELLEAQATSLELPLFVVEVSEKTNLAYEEAMLAEFEAQKLKGISHIIFGDIFLEDLRKYREILLAKVGLTGVFPLWKKDTATLASFFIAEEFKTITCCINDAQLNENFCGRNFDEEFLSELPASVDPCGENGEFHTFCYAGPIFKKEIEFTTAEKIYRPLELQSSDRTIETKGFWYMELLRS